MHLVVSAPRFARAHVDVRNKTSHLRAREERAMEFRLRFAEKYACMPGETCTVSSHGNIREGNIHDRLYLSLSVGK